MGLDRQGMKDVLQRPPTDFAGLVDTIVRVHHATAAQAARAVNVSLTLRNWLIGAYVREYEQQGADRAQYGEDLLRRLSDSLAAAGSVKYHARELARCRAFYVAYPQIRGTLSPELMSATDADGLPGVGSRTGEGAPGAAPATAQPTAPEPALPPQRLLQALSYSHFVELIALDDPLKRRFYEIECIQGNWSVRELKRQIHSLYFERSGLSIDQRKLSSLTNEAAERAPQAFAVRDPYVFEFLGLAPQEVMSESHLEAELTAKLEAFLLELGHGFCFEARQKRILIGDEQYFVDLVFYHRILKCHVLVELKLAEFTHENIGQLNTYVSWYRKHMMTAGDNPPIGILLCTHKRHSLVEYALAGLDNQVFVSKYQLELPRPEQMQKFLADRLREAGVEAGKAGEK